MQGSLFHIEPGHDGGPARITPKVERPERARPDPADTRSALEGKGPAVQKANLDRVAESIGDHVVAFLLGVPKCRDARLLAHAGDEAEEGDRLFRANDLVTYVNGKLDDQGKPPVAPDSPVRIMRELNRRGVIGYTLMSRRKSVYRVDRLPF